MFLNLISYVCYTTSSSTTSDVKFKYKKSRFWGLFSNIEKTLSINKTNIIKNFKNLFYLYYTLKYNNGYIFLEENEIIIPTDDGIEELWKNNKAEITKIDIQKFYNYPTKVELNVLLLLFSKYFIKTEKFKDFLITIFDFYKDKNKNIQGNKNKDILDNLIKILPNNNSYSIEKIYKKHKIENNSTFEKKDLICSEQQIKKNFKDFYNLYMQKSNKLSDDLLDKEIDTLFKKSKDKISKINEKKYCCSFHGRMFFLFFMFYEYFENDIETLKHFIKVIFESFVYNGVFSGKKLTTIYKESENGLKNDNNYALNLIINIMDKMTEYFQDHSGYFPKSMDHIYKQNNITEKQQSFPINSKKILFNLKKTLALRYINNIKTLQLDDITIPTEEKIKEIFTKYKREIIRNNIQYKKKDDCEFHYLLLVFLDLLGEDKFIEFMKKHFKVFQNWQKTNKKQNIKVLINDIVKQSNYQNFNIKLIDIEKNNNILEYLIQNKKKAASNKIVVLKTKGGLSLFKYSIAQILQLEFFNNHYNEAKDQKIKLMHPNDFINDLMFLRGIPSDQHDMETIYLNFVNKKTKIDNSKFSQIITLKKLNLDLNYYNNLPIGDLENILQKKQEAFNKKFSLTISAKSSKKNTNITKKSKKEKLLPESPKGSEPGNDTSVVIAFCILAVFLIAAAVFFIYNFVKKRRIKTQRGKIKNSNNSSIINTKDLSKRRKRKKIPKKIPKLRKVIRKKRFRKKFNKNYK